jgi:DNA-binding GntR family transcriptional regulator
MSAAPLREALRGSSLARRGTADLLAAEIRARILTGDLMPGDPLREADLAEVFGVARNTVREGLRLLTQEGLASHEVHRGVTVRRHTPAEVREIFEVRTLLETAVSRRAGSLTTDEVARLRAVLDESERAAGVPDPKGVLTANLDFHREMVRLLGNPRLDEMFDQLLAEIRLILTSLGADVAGPWLERNRELLELLEAGSAAAFEEELRAYMWDSDAAVVAHLQPAPE